MIILIIQSLIFISFITLIVKKFGVLPSISQSWYELEKELKVLFTLFCWGIGTTMLFHTVGYSASFFLSGAGFFFVGAATEFKVSRAYTKQVHFGGAAIGIGAALIGLIVDFMIWWPLVTFLISTAIIKFIKLKNSIWWIEIVAFIVITIGLIHKNFQ